MTLQSDSPSREVVRREVRFVTHVPATDERDDIHYIKEQITYSDNTKEPKVTILRNFEIPMYVTAPHKRDHVEKKEFEHKSNLLVRMGTESDRGRITATLLDMPWLAERPNVLKKSPYVYGYDFSAANYIKYASLKSNNFEMSEYTVAALDVETDTDTDELLISSVVMMRNGKLCIHASIIRHWVEGIPDLEKTLKKMFEEKFPNYLNNYDIKVNVHDDHVSLLRDQFRTANMWGPDFLSIWNMEFDVKRIILTTLENYGVDPIDVICDPRLPRNERYFKWVDAPAEVITANGTVKKKDNYDKWHKVYSTSTFQIIDSMCVRRVLRIHKGKEQSYALDAILAAEKIEQKVRYKAGSHLSGVSWHVFMRTYHILEYIIYNFGDNIRLIEYDAKTKDLGLSVPVGAGVTGFNDYGSSEAKNRDSFFIFGLERDLIHATGTNLQKLYEDLAKDPNVQNKETYLYEVFGNNGWIQTVPQGSFVRNGLTLFTDYPELITNARGNASDLDSVSSYPSCIEAGNVSRETTRSELIAIEGKSEVDSISIVLGTIVGHTNILALGESTLGLPSTENIFADIDSGVIDMAAYGHVPQ